MILKLSVEFFVKCGADCHAHVPHNDNLLDQPSEISYTPYELDIPRS